jgi:hypothetical protein
LLVILALGALIVLGVLKALDRWREKTKRYEELREGVARVHAAFEHSDMTTAEVLTAHLHLIARFGYNSGQALGFREEHPEHRDMLCLDDG